MCVDESGGACVSSAVCMYGSVTRSPPILNQSGCPDSSEEVVISAYITIRRVAVVCPICAKHRDVRFRRPLSSSTGGDGSGDVGKWCSRDRSKVVCSPTMFIICHPPPAIQKKALGLFSYIAPTTSHHLTGRHAEGERKCVGVRSATYRQSCPGCQPPMLGWYD